MKRAKTVKKRSLVASIAILCLCVAALIGGTFAWFTDTASTGVNTITAGNLDVEVTYTKDNGTTWKSLESADDLFQSSTWEPGHTEYVTLKVENKGSLGLNYKMLVTPVSENGGINMAGESFKLSDYLVFGSTAASTTQPDAATRDAARALIGTTTGLNQGALTQESTIVAGGDAQYITLVVYMPESVGNEANFQTGTTAPSIELGIKVVATQLANESDSYGSNYDAGAINDSTYAGVGAYYEYFKAVTKTQTADNSGNFTITSDEKAANTEDKFIAEVSGTAEQGASVSLTVTKSAAAESSFSVEKAEGEDLAGYDIKVSGQTENSLVQGKLYVGTGLENFKFYHNSVVMTVGTKGSLADGQYYYDSTDGYVYFATTSFSPYQATYKSPVAGIGTAVYGTMQDAIKAAPATTATTITLLKNVDAGGSFGFTDDMVNAGKNIVLDLNGHTYAFNEPGMGSKGTETQAMHFINGNTMYIKDGKLAVTSGSTAMKRMIQNYCDLTLENVTVDCTNLVYKGQYDNSMCRGTLTLKGNTNFIATSSTAKIFDVDGSYCKYNCDVAVVFAEDFTGTINGQIEYVASSTAGHTSTLTINAGTFNDWDPSSYVPTNKGVVKSGSAWVVTDLWTSHAATSFATAVDTTNKIVTVASAEELALFAKDAQTNYAGYTVNLTADIDLGAYGWKPISWFNASNIFNGNGHSISNMMISDMSLAYSGFFDKFGGTIKNVTFKNANVKGQRCSVVAEYTKACKVELDNVSVLNSTINGVQKNAALIGFAGGAQNGGCTEVVIKDCTVDGLVFGNELGEDSAWQCGAVIGYAFPQQNITVTGTTVKNISITYDPAISCPSVPSYASHPFIGSIATRSAIYSGTGYEVVLSNNKIEGTNTGFATSNTCTTYIGGCSGFTMADSASVTVDGVSLNTAN